MAVPHHPVQLTPDQRAAIVEGLARLTESLTPQRLLTMMESGASLYRDYLGVLQRLALDKLLRDNREITERMTSDEMLMLLEAGRPDLHATLVLNGGVQWFASQWREMRAAVL